MKRLTFICLLILVAAATHGQGILNQVKEKAQQRVDQKVDQAIDKTLDDAESSTKEKNKSNTAPAEPQPTSANAAATSASPAREASFQSYQNYDFVPGDKVLFEDDWSSDDAGEFPAHWKLTNGEFLVNKYKAVQVLIAKERSDNNGGSEDWEILPRMKKENYLPSEFTVELHFTGLPQQPREGYSNMRSHDLNLRIYGSNENSNNAYGDINLSFYETGQINTRGFANDFHRTPLSSGETHLLTTAFKNNQLKVYLDGQRLFTLPELGFTPTRLALGFGTENNAVTLATVIQHIRIAEGGNMNLVKKLSTDSRFIARGIVFDYNKATLLPESMGELNRITAFMRENESVSFEIGGHTDSDGDEAYNLKLSQQRADAVKTKLVEMGISANRLSCKGFGESKPVSDNQTPEGKANNRRVEFVKK